MNVASSSTGLLFFAFLASTVLGAAVPAPPGSWVLVVEAGRIPRKDTPVRVEVPGDRLGEPLRAALAGGPKPVHLRELRDGSPVGEPIVAQAERTPGAPEGRIRLRFSRTLDDVGRASPGSVVAAPLHQATLSTRARSNTNPARPYICRLIVFNRFT